jgi:hypothetical protein
MTKQEFEQHKQRIEQIYAEFQQSLNVLKAEQARVIAELAKNVQDKQVNDIRAKIKDIQQ